MRTHKQCLTNLNVLNQQPCPSTLNTVRFNVIKECGTNGPNTQKMR